MSDSPAPRARRAGVPTRNATPHGTTPSMASPEATMQPHPITPMLNQGMQAPGQPTWGDTGTHAVSVRKAIEGAKTQDSHPSSGTSGRSA